MNKKNNFLNLKKDLLKKIKADGLKITFLHFAYLFILLFVTLFLLSAILAKISFFNDFNDSLLSFKTTYQQSGQITQEQGLMLTEFSLALKQAFFSSSIIIIFFALIYGFLRGLKTLILHNILFNKKFPKYHLIKSSLINFVSLMGLSLLLSLLMLYLTNLFFIFVLGLIFFILFESITVSYETKNLFKKKSFWFLLIEHYLFNLKTVLFFVLGFILLIIVSSLFVLVNSSLSVFLFLLFIFGLYLKRELILYLVFNGFEDKR